MPPNPFLAAPALAAARISHSELEAVFAAMHAPSLAPFEVDEGSPARETDFTVRARVHDVLRPSLSGRTKGLSRERTLS